MAARNYGAKIGVFGTLIFFMIHPKNMGGVELILILAVLASIVGVFMRDNK
jgi:hypothetical protein